MALSDPATELSLPVAALEASKEVIPVSVGRGKEGSSGKEGGGKDEGGRKDGGIVPKRSPKGRTMLSDRSRGLSIEGSPMLHALTEPGGVQIDRTVRPMLATMAYVHPCLRFLCVEEEAWFVRLHVTLASEFGRVVAAVAASQGAKSVDDRLRSLHQLEQAMLVMVQVHYAAGVGTKPGQRSPNVKPALLQQRQFPFWEHIPELGLEPVKLRAARVYCATGVDQSCLLHLLGVGAEEADAGDPPRHAWQRYREWQEEEAVPAAHRAYLTELRQSSSPMRELVEKEVGLRKLTVQELARLELAHNNCVDMLLRYLTRRWELVTMMFGEEASRHCLHDWEQERALIQTSRLRLLIERRALATEPASAPTSAPNSAAPSRVDSTVNFSSLHAIPTFDGGTADAKARLMHSEAGA